MQNRRNVQKQSSTKSMVHGRHCWLTWLMVISCVVTFCWQYGLFQSDFLSTWLMPCSVESMSSGMWWSCITYAWLHGSIVHLLGNMALLISVGSAIERSASRIWWLLSYILGAAVGGLAYVWVCDVVGSPGSVVGASGAIFSLLGTYLVMLSGAKRRLPAGDRRRVALSYARTSVIRLVVFNIVYGLMSYGVANESHIGGFLVGLIIGTFAL